MRRDLAAGLAVVSLSLWTGALGAACRGGAAEGAPCRTNSDCAPGLYCTPSLRTCQPSSGLDSGVPGTDGAGLDSGADGGPPPPVCGDSECAGTETCVNCESDCGACGALCGDGNCDVNESCVTCAGDCGACGPVCGDGTCDVAEDCVTCADDCGGCGPVCGDAACDPPETCSSCAPDCGACGAVCGNGVCESGETPCGCASDCGTCVPVCGNAVLESGEECDDGDLLAGDGCGPACNTEDPCIRSPLPTPTAIGGLAAGTADDGEWHLDIAPSYFSFQGQMRSLFSIGTNGYIRPGLTTYASASGWDNPSTDADAMFGSGASTMSWLGADGDMDVATVTYDLDVANDRLVLNFGSYGAFGVASSSTDVQVIVHLTSGTFEYLYISGNFIPPSGRDWSIGVSEPNLTTDTSCGDLWDFETAASGSVMTFPLGCIANHFGAPSGGQTMGSHYTPLAGQALCFVKGATDYEVRLESIVP